MAAKIDTVTARDKLKVRRAPYWHRLNKGFYLGYRKMTADAAGTWVTRYLNEATGKQVFNSLGVLDEFEKHERFDKAVGLAREWHEHVSKGGSFDKSSIKDVCSEYVKHIRHEKGDKAADDLDARYRRWIAPDPISKINIDKLTREQVLGFRRRLMAAPVKINKAGETRERSKDSINRDMTALRAALNHAYASGAVTTDFAWREALKPIKNAGQRRELYLDRDQRRSFIKHAPEDLAAFLRGLSMLPLRPGAIAALIAGDFDSRLDVLKIGKDKHGRDRKIKLPKQTADMFREAAKNKLPAAPLFARADGKAWDKDAWKGPIKEAAAAAGLPAETTAYTLRHSVISDLVHGGLDLLTVAQISGTSVAMIEKHYGHLRSDVAASALAKLAL